MSFLMDGLSSHAGTAAATAWMKLLTVNAIAQASCGDVFLPGTVLYTVGRPGNTAWASGFFPELCLLQKICYLGYECAESVTQDSAV